MKLSAVFCIGSLLLASPVLVKADDLDDTLAALKQAVTAKETAKVKELAAKAHALNAKWQAPPPADVTDADAYKARADYAKDVDTYGEYGLYALAIQSAPATAMDLISTLEKQNSKSKYLDMPGVLTMLADDALGKKQTDRALGFANRLIAVNSQKAPEGVSEADWSKTKDAAVGRGYWIAGVIHGEKQQFRDADRDLRAALPLIKGNNAMMAPALFYLGVASYKMEKIQEAINFFKACSAIKSPFQAESNKNIARIRQQYAGLK